MIGSLTSIGIGMVIIGAGLGLGHIGGKAMDATARQPEVAGDIRANMIIIAAFVEGATLIAIVFAFLSNPQ